VGVHVHRVGNTYLVCERLRHRRRRAHWNRCPRYAERCDPPRVAQIFSRTHECVGPAVCSTPDFCQVRV